MTPDQATDIAARLGTAIVALEATLPALKRESVPEAEIVMALQCARRALDACKEAFIAQRTLERQIIDKANRR